MEILTGLRLSNIVLWKIQKVLLLRGRPKKGATKESKAIAPKPKSMACVDEDCRKATEDKYTESIACFRLWTRSFRTEISFMLRNILKPKEMPTQQHKWQYLYDLVIHISEHNQNIYHIYQNINTNTVRAI